jgi:hypothetical protein
MRRLKNVRLSRCRSWSRRRWRFGGVTICSDLHLQSDAVVTLWNHNNLPFFFWSRGIGGRRRKRRRRSGGHSKSERYLLDTIRLGAFSVSTWIKAPFYLETIGIRIAVGIHFQRVRSVFEHLIPIRQIIRITIRITRICS